MTTVVAIEPSRASSELSNEEAELSDEAELSAEPSDADDQLRAETCTVHIKKKNAGEKVGIELCMTLDNKWVHIMLSRP